MRIVVLLALGFTAVLAEDDRRAIRVGAIRINDKVLQKNIHASIDRGVAFLRTIQHKDGHWAQYETDFGGYTALALYALAASGVPADDPCIVRGVRWIKEHPDGFAPAAGTSTYSNSLLVLALTRIDAKAHKEWIHEIAKRIEIGERSSGFWTYQLGSAQPTKRDFNNPDRTAPRRNRPSAPTGSPDNSNTQFAVLALWAAESLADYPVRKSTWKKIHKRFSKGQQDRGGWSYKNKRDKNPKATMTAAGIVSLVYAHAALDRKQGGLLRARRQTSVVRGLGALGRIAQGWKKRGPRGVSAWSNYYWVYSLERVGTVLDLDPEDWYVTGARHLLKQQKKSGAWQPKGTNYSACYETSLALLFLVRGTYPPVRGAITPPDDPRTTAAVTTKEKLPDVKTSGGLSRAFFQYVDVKAERRAILLAEFHKAGPRAIGLFIEKLRDKREPVRRAAYGLLGKLLDKRMLFDPKADAEMRAMMLSPIDAWWARDSEKLAWDAARGKFVVP